MTIGELVVKLGVKADTFTVKDFAKALGNVSLEAASAVAVVGIMSDAFLDLTKNTLGLSNHLNIFSAETGLSIEQLQKWEAVARQVGVPIAAVENSVMGITKAMAGLRTGHADVDFLTAMGQLHVRTNGRSAYQVLNDVMAATKGRNPQDVSSILERGHIDPQMMALFGLSQGKFNKLASVGPTLTENDMRAMQDFQASLGRFEIVIEKAFVPALTEIEPYMKTLADVLADLVVIAGHGASGALSLLKTIKTPGEHLFWGKNDYDGPPGLGDILMDKLSKKNGGDAGDVNVTQHIHSNADPEEVARHAHSHLKREAQQANKHFNNGGY